MAIPASYPRTAAARQSAPERQTAPVRPSPRTPARPPRPALRLIRPPAQQKSRVPFILACLTIFIGSLLGALVLNTIMASAAYDMHATRLEVLRVQQANQQLATQVEELGSPDRLAGRALDLGMVPGEGISYINLTKGIVLGPDGGTK